MVKSHPEGSPLKISSGKTSGKMSGRNIKFNPYKRVKVTFLPDVLPDEIFKGDPSGRPSRNGTQFHDRFPLSEEGEGEH